MGFCDASKRHSLGKDQTHSDGATLLETVWLFPGSPLTLAANFLTASSAFTVVSSVCYTLSV